MNVKCNICGTEFDLIENCTIDGALYRCNTNSVKNQFKGGVDITCPVCGNNWIGTAHFSVVPVECSYDPAKTVCPSTGDCGYKKDGYCTYASEGSQSKCAFW